MQPLCLGPAQRQLAQGLQVQVVGLQPPFGCPVALRRGVVQCQTTAGPDQALIGHERQVSGGCHKAVGAHLNTPSARQVLQPQGRALRAQPQVQSFQGHIRLCPAPLTLVHIDPHAQATQTLRHVQPRRQRCDQVRSHMGMPCCHVKLGKKSKRLSGPIAPAAGMN